MGAVQAGASGFLVKDAPPDQMLEAIRTIHRGDAVIGPSSTKKLVEKLAWRRRRNARDRPAPPRRTDRAGGRSPGGSSPRG